jgi:hypothetical protein
MVGALANLGIHVSDQTVGNVLRRHGISPAPKRTQETTGKKFISAHMAVLAGTDFFTVEVLPGEVSPPPTYCSSSKLETRRITLAGMTRHPTTAWMLQMARNATDESAVCLMGQRYLLHDRDPKFGTRLRRRLAYGRRTTFAAAGAEPKSECFRGTLGALGQRGLLVQTHHLLGEASLRRALREYIDHYHAERNHQGKGNRLLFPSPGAFKPAGSGRVRCRERLRWFPQILLPSGLIL